MLDSRVAGLIPGVANHEARRIYDARVERARRALAQDDSAELGRQLCDAILLELWRARSITGFDAFVQDVIGLDAQRARSLAEATAAEQGLILDRLPDVAVALYLRSEMALIERCPDAKVSIRVEGDTLQMALSLPLSPPARVVEAVTAIGRSASGLLRVLLEKPRPK
jgi:hypothetical protein